MSGTRGSSDREREKDSEEEEEEEEEEDDDGTEAKRQRMSERRGGRRKKKLKEKEEEDVVFEKVVESAGSARSEIVSMRVEMLRMKSILEQTLGIDLSQAEGDIVEEFTVVLPPDISVPELKKRVAKNERELHALREEFRLMRSRLTKVLGFSLVRGKGRGEVQAVKYREGFQPTRNIREVQFREKPDPEGEEDIPGRGPARYPGFDFQDISRTSKRGEPKLVDKEGNVTAVIGGFPDSNSVLAVPYFPLCEEVQANTNACDFLRDQLVFQVQDNRRIIATMVSTIQASSGNVPAGLLIPADGEGKTPRPVLGPSPMISAPHLHPLPKSMPRVKRQGEITQRKAFRLSVRKAEMDQEDTAAAKALVTLEVTSGEVDRRSEAIQGLGVIAANILSRGGGSGFNPVASEGSPFPPGEFPEERLFGEQGSVLDPGGLILPLLPTDQSRTFGEDDLFGGLQRSETRVVV